MDKIAVLHEESEEFLGWILKDTTSWVAQTIFGYTIARVETEHDAKKVLDEKGLHYLKGVWQYHDTSDNDWFSCVITNATEHKVTVIRTNELGLQVPEVYKMVTLLSPTENDLVKVF